MRRPGRRGWNAHDFPQDLVHHRRARGFGRDGRSPRSSAATRWPPLPATPPHWTISPPVRRRSCPCNSSHRPRADFAAVQQAHERFGRLDVVVNNAGYGHFGLVEELSRGRGPRPARDQLLRRAVGHPGGAADPARAGQRPHPAGLLDRRHLRLPAGRDLSRVQVGARGHQPGAGPGGRRLRRQGHADRAGRVLHRLGRLVGQALRGTAGLRRLPQEGAGAAGSAHGRAGRSDGERRGRRSASSTPRTRRCGASSARRRWASPRSDYASRLEPGVEWQDVAELAQG